MSSLAPDKRACERTAGPRAILDIGYVVLSETASRNKGLERARRWREGRTIGTRVCRVAVGPREGGVFKEWICKMSKRDVFSVPHCSPKYDY